MAEFFAHSLSFLRQAPTCWLRVTDEDAADFLQSQFSNDLRVADGESVYGLWLDHRGKVQGDGTVIRRTGEDFVIFSEQTSASLLREKLERHIVADEVVLEDLTETIDGLTLFALEKDEKERLEPLLRERIEAGGVVFCDRSDCLRICASGACIDAIEAWLKLEGARETDESAYARWRLRRGIPLIPSEVGPGEFPGEIGFDTFCSPRKGCYLGQEVVARQQRLGRATRILKSVSLERMPSTIPVALEVDGAVVGELRAAVSEGDAAIGLALLKTRVCQSANRFNVSDSDSFVGSFLDD